MAASADIVITNAARPRLWVYLLLWTVLPPLALGYQAAAETAARGLSDTHFGAAWFAHAVTLTPLRWLIGMEIVGFGAWMVVLNHMKLAQAFPATAMSYVLILGLSAFVFHEHITALGACGALIILFGVWLVIRGSKAAL